MTAQDADDRADSQDQQGTNQSDSDAQDTGEGATGEQGLDRRHDPEYLDRDALDFDPDDGLLSGTAVEGNSDIPGPHENQDDTTDDGKNHDGAGDGDGDAGASGSGEDAADGGGGDGAAERGESERVEQGS